MNFGKHNHCIYEFVRIVSTIYRSVGKINDFCHEKLNIEHIVSPINMSIINNIIIIIIYFEGKMNIFFIYDI